MAAWDVLVEGVNLNTLAYQVDYIENRRQVPILADLGVPLQTGHGESPAVGNYAATLYGLQVWVDAVDPITGVIPSNWQAQLENNVTAVMRTMQKPRGGLLDVRVLQPSNTYQRAWSKVVAFNSTQLNNRTMRLNFGMKIPSVFWEGMTLTTLTFTNFTGALQNLTNLNDAVAPATAPITDAILRIKGPATLQMSGTTPVAPRFTTGPTVGGGQVVFSRTLGSSEMWILDCGRSASTTGVGIFDPGEGTRAMINTHPTGSQGRFFDIYPEPTYRVGVVATGTTAISNWSITTRPKFL